MKKLVIILTFLCIPAISEAAEYVSESNRLAKRQEEIMDFAGHFMTAPRLRDLYSELAAGKLPFLPFDAPVAIAKDLFLFATSAAFSTILEAHWLFETVRHKIDIYSNDHDATSLIKIAQNGLKEHQKEAETLLQETIVNKEIMMAILLGLTARDSKNYIPHGIKIGTNQIIKREVLERELNGRFPIALELYIAISKAALALNDKYLQELPEEEVTKRLIKELISPNTDDMVEILIVVESLRRAAKLALSTFAALSTDAMPGIL